MPGIVGLKSVGIKSYLYDPSRDMRFISKLDGRHLSNAKSDDTRKCVGLGMFFGCTGHYYQNLRLVAFNVASRGIIWYSEKLINIILFGKFVNKTVQKDFNKNILIAFCKS